MKEHLIKMIKNTAHAVGRRAPVITAALCVMFALAAGSVAASSAPERASAGTSAVSAPERAATPSPSQGRKVNLSGLSKAGVPNLSARIGRRGNGLVICIDPGHQDHGMSELEPNGPGSSVMKAKLTTGTYGVVSGKNEYEINLEVSLKLRDELEKRGYTVVMTRETNDVTISNAERAVLAADAGADAFLRIHCNGADNSGTNGVLVYEPSFSNPYLDPNVIEGSRRLAECLLNGVTAATGHRSLGLIPGDDMTGINWAKMPVAIVEMGYMSNPEEDMYLASESGQETLARGIADGTDAFFGEK